MLAKHCCFFFTLVFLFRKEIPRDQRRLGLLRMHGTALASRQATQQWSCLSSVRSHFLCICSQNCYLDLEKKMNWFKKTHTFTKPRKTKTFILRLTVVFLKLPRNKWTNRYWSKEKKKLEKKILQPLFISSLYPQLNVLGLERTWISTTNNGIDAWFLWVLPQLWRMSLVWLVANHNIGVE